MIKIICFLTSLFCLSTLVSSCDFSSDFCRTSGISCPSSNIFRADNTNYGGSDIDVISFNDFTLNHGDVQRRVAVRSNFYAENGTSVGDLLNDNLEYSLIVGRNLVWNNEGEVFPVDKHIFVGDSSTIAPSNIGQRISGRCSTSGCLDSAFDSLSVYWRQFSSSISSQADNVDVSYSAGIASLSCRSSSASAYYIRISPSSFNQIIGYSVSSSCSSSASWVINIMGPDDVYFGGNPIEVSGSVIFNVFSSVRVWVTSSVKGNIVAAGSDIHMVGGTIYGQVVAGNFSNVIQINKPDCPSTSSSSGSASSSSGSVSASASSSSGSASASSSSGSASASASSSSSASASGGPGPATAINENSDLVDNNDSGAISMAASVVVAFGIAIALI